MTRLLAALLGLALAACAPAVPPGPPPNLVLIVLDTTRADRLSPYGYARDTSPNLAAFARESVVFDRAYSTSSWTLPAHASLFTGMLPMTHQATQETQHLSPEFETLAERVQAAGYETALFSGNGWVGDHGLLAQGFETKELVAGTRRALRTNQRIKSWLEARAAERPFFLFVNYIEPHWPYDAPPRFVERFAGRATNDAERGLANFREVDWYTGTTAPSGAVRQLRSDLYDAEIAWMDVALGRLLGELRQQGLFETSWIVVTSDHGEALGENGHFGHAFALDEALVRVPLLVRGPGLPVGARRADPVQLPDVFATLAAAAGVSPADDRVLGKPLFAEPFPADRPLVAEYYYPRQILQFYPPEVRDDPKALASFRRRQRVLRVGEEVLLWGSDGRHGLVDHADPAAPRDVSAERPERLKALVAELEALVAQHARAAIPRPPPVPMDAATEENLRDLGYVR